MHMTQLRKFLTLSHMVFPYQPIRSANTITRPKFFVLGSRDVPITGMPNWAQFLRAVDLF